MLADFCALIAVLAPTVGSWGHFDDSIANASDHYRVDLGYQLNQGYAVMVCSYITIVMFARLLQISNLPYRISPSERHSSYVQECTLCRAAAWALALRGACSAPR